MLHIIELENEILDFKVPLKNAFVLKSLIPIQIIEIKIYNLQIKLSAYLKLP